ncbi:tRNA-intron lyase [Methanobacterium paludis]|uniref:tRNA-splicing endonuclease n=1 Tax=Methanobacterium paludis (strain DSM 25820 / JCM 18151 / SWAN1) TaxID=868131 RepID=F6D3V4_METPW|nr:tRNA-intron lyase [Methanobacterium paludis]AEG18756.1 tRNA-splicing endonuclease [Methanobacterium paludis]
MNSKLSGDLVIIEENKGAKLHEKSHYGNVTEEGLQLSLIEALYLMEKDKLEILSDDKELSLDEMFELIRSKNLFTMYIVFRDLKNRGYIVKTGFKYGSEFRLYERGKSPGDGHSNYLVKVAPENCTMTMFDLSSYVRVAHGVNKKLLFAVVDDENDITYYNMEWTRP